jgi:hypothetical protein
MRASAVARAPWLEAELHAVADVREAGQAVAQVQPLSGERARQRGQQIGAVHLVVGKAEGVLHQTAQGGAQERAAVVPAALVPGLRGDARPREIPRQPESVQDPRGVRADLDAGAHLRQLAGPLVDVDVEAGLQQRQRGAQAADAAADDGDPGHVMKTTQR